jgi:hypothetical protein
VFPHLVLLGGPAGVLERTMSLGLAERITTSLPFDGDAHAVVAYSNAAEPVDRTARAVGPGGVLYLEIDRWLRHRRGDTLGRVCRVLAREGFRVAAAYTLEPDASDPRAFVPVDTPAAARWYREAFLRAATPFARLRGLAKYSAISLAGRRSAPLLRRFAGVAGRGDRHGAAPPGILRDDDVARALGGLERAASAVVIAHGGDRVVMFPFTSRGRLPMAVVKVPRSDPFFDRTENEQRQLHERRAQLDAQMARAIPRALGLVRVGRVVAACEQFLPGQALSSRAWSRLTRAATKRDDLDRAMAWLIRFHRATEVRRAPLSDDLRRALVDDPLRAYATELGTTPEEAVLFSHARAAAAALSGVELPLVCQHRDFAVWNVLREHDRIGVLDWEGARDGPALGDALHLATTWLYLVRRGRRAADEAQCVGDLFLAARARDPAVAAARRSIDRYVHELGIDRRLVPLLVVHHRVELALRRHDQQRLQDEAEGAAGAVTRDVRVVRALAAGADRLFAGGVAPT